MNEILLICALLLFPSNTNDGRVVPDDIFTNTLALKPLFFDWTKFFSPGTHVPNSEQIEVLNALKEVAGKANSSTIIRVPSPWTMMQLLDARNRAADGGFVIVGTKDERDFLRNYFKKFKWQMMPFLYGESVIFVKPSKPMRQSA